MTAETSVSAVQVAGSMGTLPGPGTNPGETRAVQPLSFAGSPQAAGQMVGYARVSTTDQSVDRQLTELTAAGCVRIFSDLGVSGSRMERPGLTDALAYLRPWDTLAVVELSRLGRDTAGVLSLVRDLESRGVGLRVLGLGLDTATPTGRLVITILAAVAEMERQLLRERVRSGIAEARRTGRTGGRPGALTDAQNALARQLHSQGRSATAIARLLGTSDRTIRRALGAPS